MTVNELITELQKYPGDMPVFHAKWGDGAPTAFPYVHIPALNLEGKRWEDRNTLLQLTVDARTVSPEQW
jgi:hypothetical protein